MARGTDEDVFLEDNDNISLQIQEFGCHLRWKELQKVDRLALKNSQEVLRGETWYFSERPTYFTAVRNLQGFIEYKLDNESEAEDFFVEVLDHDPVNINALANMIHILRGQLRVAEVREYEERLRKIFEQSQDRLGYCSSYPQRARAYADRAHAIRYFEQDKRCFHYMTYVERAATLGKYCRDTPDRAEWFFDHALALYRRDVQMLYLRKISGDNVSDVLQRKIKSGFEKAVRTFYDVIQLSKSTSYLSLSWVFIGILLNHDPENRSLERIFPREPELHSMRADDCFTKGLSINDTHEITTRRVGAEYVKLKRYEEAKRLLDRSIRKLKSWFAHRYRGVLFLSVFEDDAVTDDQLQSKFNISERRSLLLMAKTEFEEAQKERSVHADFSDLGRVYFHLGERRKAVPNFKKACDSQQDDYFDVLMTYRRWIECIGEDKHDQVTYVQEKCDKHRRNLLETPLDTNGDSFSDDFEHFSMSAIDDHVRLLTEADFFVATATGHTRHHPMPNEDPIPPGQFKYHFFLSFSERDRIWSLAFFNKLETECKLRGCIEQRDFQVGAYRTDTIQRCLKESHHCIVVLSPHYVQDKDSRPILKAAFRLAFERDRYVLPVLLTDCDFTSLDDRLGELKRIECNRGQIRNCYWQNLVSTLKHKDER